MSKQFKSTKKRKSIETKLQKRFNYTQKFNESFLKSFICIGSNGIQLVIDVLLKFNMRMIANDKDPSYYIKWTDIAQQVDWNLYVEFEHMINHIPHSELITNKGNLLHCLRQYERLSKAMQKSYFMNLDSFVPESYIVNNPKELNRFYENIENSEMWIYKPTGLNQGIGISLIRGRNALDIVLSKDQNDSNKYRRPMGKIVQRYIMNPLLINCKKFDIRAYMLIANTVPFLVLYHPGYLRLSMENYSNESDNMLIHLTNQFIQKKDPKYNDIKEDTVWSMEQFNVHCNDHLHEYPRISKNWVKYVLNNKMKTIMRQVFFSVKNKLSRGVGLFELFGFDFMIDNEFKTWLIEVNMNPSMNTNCEVLKQKLPTLIKNTIDISVECFEKCKRQENILPIQNQKEFEIIYFEDNNWNWKQYISNNKEILATMKTRQLSSKSILQRQSNDTILKQRQNQNDQLILKHRSHSVPLLIQRKFPSNMTYNHYRESTHSQLQTMDRWLKS